MGLQALGTLDSINSMSYEQFLIDLEVWGYIRRLSAPPIVDPERLAWEVIAERPSNYMSKEHTVRFLRNEQYVPQLALAESYLKWMQGGGKGVVGRAASLAEKRFPEHSPPPLDAIVEKELNRFVSSRTRKFAER